MAAQQHPDTLDAQHACDEILCNRGCAAATAMSRRKFVVIGSAVSAVAALGSLLNASPAMAAGIVDSTIGSLQERAQELVAQAEELMDALGQMDYAAAKDKAYGVRDLAEDLRDELSGGLWSMAQIVPVYGGDVTAARKLVDIVVSLSNDAVVPLCEVLAENPPETLLTTWSGSIDVKLDPLQSIIDVALAALESLRTNVAALDEVGEFHIDELSGAMEQIRAVVDPYRDKFDTVEGLLKSLPRLIGSEGARIYMVVAQTNCEIRSTGGFPGAICLITADRGTITMNGFGSMYDYMPRNPSQGLAITDEESALFGPDVSWYAGIMNFIPHFPRVCDLWSQAFAANNGYGIDGVIAIDPVLLQNLLGIYGSVTMEDGTVIDGTNAARMLMNDVYLRYVDNNDAQDTFFSSAAQAVFDHITQNLMQGDMGAVASTVADGMDARRLTLWMADADEEALLGGAGCTGELCQDPKFPQAGIYLGNETWGKIDWWLDTVLQVRVGDSGELVDLTHLPKKEVGQVGDEVHAVYTLANTLSWDDVTPNGYVFGSSPSRRMDGDMVLKVWLYAPMGGTIANMVCSTSESGFTPTFAELSHMGLQVMFGMVQLLPGESITIEYDVTCSNEAQEELVFDVTPICHD